MSIPSIILFSCVGTTDPVRGCHDGSLLHIMRHYRPQKIYLFLSAEMTAFETVDRRFSKAIQYAHEHWNSYDPLLEMIDSNIKNPNDLDTVYAPIQQYFLKVMRDNPDSRVLINLSSGTPQMKMVLAQLALDVRFNALGVQVSNPEKQSGDTKRTNHKDFNVDEELQLNEDDETDAPNRCSEPRMLFLQREQRLERIRSLLERRDYHALLTMQAELPETLRPLIQHLAARSDLESKTARALARKIIGLDFVLYPAQKGSNGEYNEMSEYYLLLRNLQLTQRYSELVLRMNPFLVRLMLRQIEQSLPCALADILEPRWDERIRLSPDRLQQKLPEQKHALEQKQNIMLDADRDFSLHIGVAFLWVLKEDDPKWSEYLKLLTACNNLNIRQRNIAAHQLHAVTEEMFKESCAYDKNTHYNPATVVRELGQMLREAYPDVCDPKLFTIYDRCNEYILKKL